MVPIFDFDFITISTEAFMWLSGLMYSKNQWLWYSEECKSIYSGRISRSNALNPEGVPFTTSTAYLEVDPGIDVVPVRDVRGELLMRVDPVFVPEVAVPDHSKGGIHAQVEQSGRVKLWLVKN